MDFLKLTCDTLSVDEIMKLVSSGKCGAVSIFVGTTRDNFEDKQVIHLEYEAYDEMALKVMKDLCNDIRTKWGDVQHIAIYHRLGVVPVLESSIVIAISSPHRVDSMAAVQYCIENLKGNKIFSRVNEEECYKVNTDPENIQVNATNDEIEKRIQNFIERKREQINICNVQDFIFSNNINNTSNASEGETSCARVDAVLIKRKDSKGHLKVKKVKNEWGPQTKIEKVQLMDKICRNDGHASTNSGIEERLENAEKHLNITKPISKDIYDRLKKIEDRILDLESLSPEYVSFWMRNPTDSNEDLPNSGQPANRNIKYNANDILQKINAIKGK